MANPHRTAVRAAATVTALLACTLALSACAAPSTGSADGTSSPTPTTAGTPAPTPTPTPTPTDPPTPVTLSCDQVVTPDQVYAFNPNFGVDPGYQPKEGSLEKQIADWKGVTCAWLNQTSGDVIEIAVAQPPASSLEGLKNAAITAATPVPTYGVPPEIEGYFKQGTPGQVQVFRGAYWIVADSSAFFEPGDAAPLLQDVLANLPA